ncbi:MAG: homoserine kinase [Ardenticatenaceae bacterium]|nr:homoserine kinase [Ardenticatenaceae bacterium]
MQATITIPATSANLGPGFDCLGLALSLYQSVTFTVRSDPGLVITACGEDAPKIPTDESNLIWQSAELIFERYGQRPLGLHIHQDNQIPIGSGLGSSSSAVLAGLFGANALLGNPLSRAEILQQATDLEGHPDNVAPAVYGGLILGVQEAGGLLVESIATPPLRVVVVLPDFHLPTAEARAALPQQVSLRDAIFNTSRLGLLIRALETADYDKIRAAMQDRLHQPYRLPLVPGLAAAYEAAYAAGAAGVALSGAGPSLIAFAPSGHEAIGAAVTAVFARHQLASRSWILSVDTRGSQVRVDDPVLTDGSDRPKP